MIWRTLYILYSMSYSSCSFLELTNDLANYYWQCLNRSSQRWDSLVSTPRQIAANFQCGLCCYRYGLCFHRRDNIYYYFGRKDHHNIDRHYHSVFSTYVLNPSIVAACFLIPVIFPNLQATLGYHSQPVEWPWWMAKALKGRYRWQTREHRPGRWQWGRIYHVFPVVCHLFLVLQARWCWMN